MATLKTEDQLIDMLARKQGGDSYAEIGHRYGMSGSWCSALVKAYASETGVLRRVLAMHNQKKGGTLDPAAVSTVRKIMGKAVPEAAVHPVPAAPAVDGTALGLREEILRAADSIKRSEDMIMESERARLEADQRIRAAEAAEQHATSAADRVLGRHIDRIIDAIGATNTRMDGIITALRLIGVDVNSVLDVLTAPTLAPVATESAAARSGEPGEVVINEDTPWEVGVPITVSAVIGDPDPRPQRPPRQLSEATKRSVTRHVMYEGRGIDQALREVGWEDTEENRRLLHGEMESWAKRHGLLPPFKDAERTTLGYRNLGVCS